jgi:hypothetical protein
VASISHTSVALVRMGFKLVSSHPGGTCSASALSHVHLPSNIFSQGPATFPKAPTTLTSRLEDPNCQQVTSPLLKWTAIKPLGHRPQRTDPPRCFYPCHISSSSSHRHPAGEADGEHA